MYEDSLFSTSLPTLVISCLPDNLLFYFLSLSHTCAISRFYTQYPNVLLMVILRGQQREMVEGEPCLWKVERREPWGGEVIRPSWSPDRVFSPNSSSPASFPAVFPVPPLTFLCLTGSPSLVPLSGYNWTSQRNPWWAHCRVGVPPENVLILVRRLNVGEKALFKELQPAWITQGERQVLEIGCQLTGGLLEMI